MKNKLNFKSVLVEGSEVMTARISWEDSLVAVGYGDGLARVFNLSTENKVTEIRVGDYPVTSLRWRPQQEEGTANVGILLAGSSNGELLQCLPKSGKTLWKHSEQPNQVLAMDYHGQGRKFATAGKDNVVRVYDEEHKKVTQELAGVTWTTQGHNNRLFALKFPAEHPDLLLSGGWDHNVNVWDLRTSASVLTIYGPRLGGDGIDVDGEKILTGSHRSRDQLQMWDLRTAQLLFTFPWNDKKEDSEHFINAAQFSRHAKNIAVGAGGARMRLFSVESRQPLVDIDIEDHHQLFACDSAYHSTRYVCGGKQGMLLYFTSNKPLE